MSDFEANSKPEAPHQKYERELQEAGLELRAATTVGDVRDVLEKFLNESVLTTMPSEDASNPRGPQSIRLESGLSEGIQANTKEGVEITFTMHVTRKDGEERSEALPPYHHQRANDHYSDQESLALRAFVDEVSQALSAMALE